MKKNIIVLFIIAAFAGLLFSCGDTLTGGKLSTDPNRVTEVPIGSMLSASEVNSFYFQEHLSGWLVAMWMQQMCGAAVQYNSYSMYDITEASFSHPWNLVYSGAGLVNIRVLQEAAEESGNLKVLGIAKILEAFMIGTTASLWGDIPYSEAIVSEKATLDAQSSVYDNLQTLLTSAIADLSTGTGFLENSAADHYYGGDAAKWNEMAHSLKARLYLEWAEADNSNYALALAEAQQGISSRANNFKALHSDESFEENCWYQFEALVRHDDMVAGKFLVELLKSRNDGRLQKYFGLDDYGEYSGSDPGEGNSAASYLNPDTYGAKDWSSEFVTWEETQFSIAECQHAANDDDAALLTLDGILQVTETRWGIILPRYSGTGLTHTEVLEVIMTEKYIAMFLNIIVWSDWKRTGYPQFTMTYNDQPLPRRFLYSANERQANPNIPDPSTAGLYMHNENDPH